MAGRGSFSEGGDLDLLVLLPDGRSVTHSVHSNCPMMDLLIQIASRENLKPSAYVIEPLLTSDDNDDAEYSTRPIIAYKPNTPIGMLNTQVIRLAPKNHNSSKMPSASTVGSANSYERKISHSESFSNRVQNFNKLSGHSAIDICNDPDGFNKLSEETKKIKSRSNYITSALPPQVTNNEATTQRMNTFRLQIHLPFEQLHVIRASPEDTVGDVLDIIQDERGLKLERYLVFKTNDPDLQLNLDGTLKEFAITELTLKLKPEFDVIRNSASVNPKKVKKENSSHFRSAFKSFFSQLKPASRSNSVTELRHASDTIRPKSEIIGVTNQTEFAKPKAPPRKRTHAPPPPVQNQITYRVSDTMPLARSHTASESSCESTCGGSVGGSAPATLPRRCRLGPESVSTTNLSIEPPMPALRRGVSDLAVNKPKYPRRKRLAPRPPTLVSNEELKEDRIEEQATHKIVSNEEFKEDRNEQQTLQNIVNNEELKEDRIEEQTAQKSEIISEEITSSHKDILLDEHTHALNSNIIDEKLVQNDTVAQKNECEEYITLDAPRLRDNMPKQLKINETYAQEQVETLLSTEHLQSDQDFIKTKPLTSKEENQIQVKSQNLCSEISPISNKTEEVQNHSENEQEPILFSQKISNGQHLVVVDINIDDSEDPNDNNFDPHEDRAVKKESSDFVCNKSYNNASISTTTDRDNINMEVLKSTKSNLEVEVEIHSQKNIPLIEEGNLDNEKYIELRHAPSASKLCNENVEPFPTVEKPEHKVLPSFPRTVISISSNRQSCTLPSSKLDDNLINKNPPQRSISTGATIASKPTVDDLLKQIEKIKQKSTKNSQKSISNETHLNKKLNGHYQPEIVGLVEKIKSVNEPMINAEMQTYVEKSNESVSKNDLFDKPRENGAIKTCATPPVSPESEFPPAINGHTEEAKSLLVTDVVAKLNSVERRISAETASFKPRPAPSFMLTSWVEEKRPPLVNRIADYGSRSSVKVPIKDPSVKKESFENILPSLAATLPRPFTKPIEASIKSSTINRPPTIINVLEKSEVQKQNENPPTFLNGRQSAYAKLNLYNLTPKILADPFIENGDPAPVQKTSWELVQDASKKLQENKINGDHKTDINDNHQNNENGHYTHVGKMSEEKLYENGTDSTHMYKYSKPLQFQLGTWNDKAKGLKIEPEVKSDKKDDPPLVKDIDGVAVWSATY